MFIALQFGGGQGRVNRQRIASSPMRLLSDDLLRNFAIGFAGGALAIAAANFNQWGEELAPPAQAAAMMTPPAPSAGFVIAPEGN